MDLGVYHYVSKLIVSLNDVIIRTFIARRCRLEGNGYTGQGCPVPKTCLQDSCWCPPLHIDAGTVCVPNDDVLPENTTTESSSES